MAREPGDDKKTPPAVPILAVVPPRPTRKTPPGVIITEEEKEIVRTSTRTFIKGVVPHLPALAKYGAIAIGLFAMFLQHWLGKANTAEKVMEAKVEAKETTQRAYRGLAKPTRDLAAEVAALEVRLTASEATNKAQSALLAARERDFVVEGRPVKTARRRVDPGLVKAVQANAAKDSKELAARKAKPAPAIALPPLELPPAPPANTPAPEVPKPPTPPAQKTTGAEWPPPVPVQPTEAAP